MGAPEERIGGRSGHGRVPVQPSGGVAPVAVPPSPIQASSSLDAVGLERRGRAWLLWSFLLCPCHLPWTLAVFGAVFAGSSFGVVLADHAWLAGGVVSAAWVGGTAYGFRLIRRAERAGGSCEVRDRRRIRNV